MTEFLEAVSQVMIPVLGLAALYLGASQHPKTRMWAGICGLSAEPAWFYTAWYHSQVGIMVLAIVYSIGWMRMARNNYRAYNML